MGIFNTIRRLTERFSNHLSAIKFEKVSVMTIQSQLSTFKFESNSIRTLAINNEPWFIAKDLCDAINISNYRDAIEKLDEDEKGVALTDTLGGKQEMAVVSESGMYTLILRCREAVKKGSIPHRFRKWVTAEVLPQIRKTGSYSKTTTDQRTGLRNAVSMLVGKKALMYNEAYNLVHQRFNVGSIEDLTAEQLPQAVEYVHKIYLEGELIIDTPKERTHSINDARLLNIVSMWFALYNSLDLLSKIHKPLNMLNSHYGVAAYTHATEYRNTLGLMKRLLEPMTDGLIVNPIKDGHYHLALKTLRNFEPTGLGSIARF